MRLPPNFPIAPAKVPFFYGWIIVVVATLGIIASMPGQTMGVSVFTPKLEAAMRLSRTQLSLAYAIGTITSGLLLTKGGRLVDRFGVRIMMMLASSCLAVSLLILSMCDRISDTIESVVGSALHVVVAMCVSTVGFFLIRFWGQGMMAMVARVMVGKWFQRRRGLAVGLSGVFASFGFSTSPLFLNMLVEAFGWRNAYGVLAALVGGGMGLVAWIFYRERPEDFGLLKDGRDYSAVDAEKQTDAVVQRDFTLSEARRSFEFWLYSFGLGTHGMIITGFTFHMIAIGNAAELPEGRILTIFLPMSVISVVSNLTGGWISDKTKLKYLLMVQQTGIAVGTVGLALLSLPVGPVMTIAGFGVAGGLFGCLVGVTYPRFFGLLHLGAISGQNMSVMVLMSALGPIIFAVSQSISGSFMPGILLCVVLPVITLMATFPSGNPQDRYVDSPEE